MKRKRKAKAASPEQEPLRRAFMRASQATSANVVVLDDDVSREDVVVVSSCDDASEDDTCVKTRRSPSY